MARPLLVARLFLILCVAVDAGNWELPSEVEADVSTAYETDFLKACDGGDEKVVRRLLNVQALNHSHVRCCSEMDMKLQCAQSEQRCWHVATASSQLAACDRISGQLPLLA